MIIDYSLVTFMDRVPLLAFKTMEGDNVIYETWYAKVYYCGEERHYVEKNSKYSCPKVEQGETLLRDWEFMAYSAEDWYTNDLWGYRYNQFLNRYAYTSLGSNYVSENLWGWYLYSVDDYEEVPIKIEIDGKDMDWRTTDNWFSNDGKVMAFWYNCGYFAEQWMGEQKYTQEDCLANEKESGAYVYTVNSDFTYDYVGFLRFDERIFDDEALASYFRISEVVSEEEVELKYIITDDINGEPIEIKYFVWNPQNGGIFLKE